MKRDGGPVFPAHANPGDPFGPFEATHGRTIQMDQKRSSHLSPTRAAKDDEKIKCS